MYVYIYSAYSYVYEYALGLPNFQLINYSGATLSRKIFSKLHRHIHIHIYVRTYNMYVICMRIFTHNYRRVRSHLLH